MSQRKNKKLLSKRRAKFYEEEDEGQLDLNVVKHNNDIIDNNSDDHNNNNNANENENDDEDILNTHISKMNQENDTFSLTEIGVVGKSKKQLPLELNVNVETNINEEDSNTSSSIDNQTQTHNEYLQSKLSHMNVPNNLISNIRKQIKQQNLQIQKELYNNEIPFSAVPKTITSLIKNREKTLLNQSSSSNQPNNAILSLSNETLKHLRILKSNENKLKTQISSLESKIIFLQNESSSGMKGNIINSNIRQDQLKQLKEDKQIAFTKLENISLQINMILECLNKKPKHDILKSFTTNFEDDTALINKNLQPIITQSNKQKELFELNISKLNQKRNEMELEDKSKELKRRELLLKLRDKELQTVSRRKKYFDEQLEKTLQSIKDESVHKEKDYLYYINTKKYEEREKQLLDLVKLQQKNKVKLITIDELKEFQQQFKVSHVYDKEQELEKIQSDLVREKMWNNSAQVKVMSEQEKQAQMIKNKRKEELLIKQKEYVNTILPQVKIKIDDKLVKEREEKNNNLTTNRNNIISLKNKIKKNKYVLTLTKVPHHSQLIKRKENAQEDGDNKNNNKPKKIVFPTRKVPDKPDKPIDYLQEMRLAKDYRNNSAGVTRNYVGNVDAYLEKNNLVEGIALAKNETEILDNKLKEKKMMMNNNGGYSNNEELGNEIGELLVNSIQAKLKILEKFNSD